MLAGRREEGVRCVGQEEGRGGGRQMFVDEINLSIISEHILKIS